MAQTTFLTSRAVPAGETISPSQQVPAAVSHASMQFDLTGFATTATLSLYLQCSRDNFVTWWDEAFVGGVQGGPNRDHQGNVVPAGGFFTDFPPHNNSHDQRRSDVARR
jgi:hypothetical protein